MLNESGPPLSKSTIGARAEATKYSCDRKTLIWIVNCYQNNRIWKSIYTRGKAWQIEAGKSSNHNKTLQDYMRHIEQLSHHRKKRRFIVRHFKILHHSCEYTQRYKTFVLMCVRCTAIIWFAFGRVWIVCMSTIWGELTTT